MISLAVWACSCGTAPRDTAAPNINAANNLLCFDGCPWTAALHIEKMGSDTTELPDKIGLEK
ncbi:hypothetical protein NBRC116593_43750 [Sulfitobacter pacificus]